MLTSLKAPSLCNISVLPHLYLGLKMFEPFNNLHKIIKVKKIRKEEEKREIVAQYICSLKVRNGNSREE